ncbi:hypothetical protein G6011_01818 [Alternaria panax]|uniref:Uncharacterized protein n=1 Tax=Alternaria panax TaxID=48097 RepID=A0AAD4ILA6_9PLEO|nr:hypothetical protein G6011_01818 [Alternaria panax]
MPEGVVVQQLSGCLGEEMVMPTTVQAEGITLPVDRIPAIMESVDERPAGSEVEAELEDADNATETHPHTDGTSDTSTAPGPIVPEEAFSNRTFTPPTTVCSVATTTIFENPLSEQALNEPITTPQRFEIAPAQKILSYTPSQPSRTKIYSNSKTTSQRTGRSSDETISNYLDCFLPYMRFLE